MFARPASGSINNRILTALSKSQHHELFSALEPTSLSLSEVLYKAGDLVKYVYFPNDALISMVASKDDQTRSFEVCIVGADGMIGAPTLQHKNHALFTSIVRRPGTAFRAKASVVREALDCNVQFQSSLFPFMQRLITQVAQSAVCNSFHAIDKRLARWLLVMNDYTTTKAPRIPATHDFLASMLGERRVSVTQAANRLREAEVISYGRGWIQVINRSGLESASCPCYWTISRRPRRRLS